MAKKIMMCISEPSSNQHFSVPYVVGEKVVYLGEVEPDKEGRNPQIYYDQFVRIQRLKPFEKRVEFKKNFANI